MYQQEQQLGSMADGVLIGAGVDGSRKRDFKEPSECLSSRSNPPLDTQKVPNSLTAAVNGCFIFAFAKFAYQFINMCEERIKKFTEPEVEQSLFRHLAKLDNSSFILGLKQILSENDISARILRSTYPEAADMVRANIIKYPQKLHAKLQTSFKKSSSNSMPMDYTLLHAVREYSDKIELTKSDGKPRTSKKKGKRKSKERRVDYIDAWQGPTQWDSLLGGDGCPKFLCDVMGAYGCILGNHGKLGYE
ncbi:hypothetical protein Tco_0360859 [Tanacetum coccineum]